MMYTGKNGQYVAVGVQGTPAMRLNVRSNVRLPDSEAGVSWYDAAQKPFYAETVAERKRAPLTIPLNNAPSALPAARAPPNFLGFAIFTSRTTSSPSISEYNASTSIDFPFLPLYDLSWRCSTRVK